MQELMLKSYWLYNVVIIFTILVMVFLVGGIGSVIVSKLITLKYKSFWIFLLRSVMPVVATIFLGIQGIKGLVRALEEKSIKLSSGTITSDISYIIKDSGLLTLNKTVKEEVNIQKESMIEDGVFVIKDAVGFKETQERIVDVKCNVGLSECLDKIKKNLDVIIAQKESSSIQVVQF